MILGQRTLLGLEHGFLESSGADEIAHLFHRVGEVCAAGQRFVVVLGQRALTGLEHASGHPHDLVVADHSDNMGFFPRLYSGEPDMLADETGKRWYNMVQAGGQQAVEAAVEIIIAVGGVDVIVIVLVGLIIIAIGSIVVIVVVGIDAAVVAIAGITVLF